MTQDNSKELLKSVLQKRRDCIPLNEAEQKFVDETYGKLFEKKFGSRTFVVKTGTEIRKAATKPSSVQPDAAIADERSKFGTKDSKIENDDPSGAVKATETNDMVNVDEKDGDKAAEQTNASDITNADNENEQRKPTLKFAFGDPVIKMIGERAIAGVIVQAYTEKRQALVKWSNGTFSYIGYDSMEKVADKYKKEDEHTPPVTADSSGEVKTPGTDKADEAKAIKPDAVKKDDSSVADAKAEAADEAKENAKEEAKETKEEEKAEEDKEDETEKAFYEKCEKAVGSNPLVEDAPAVCKFIRTTMKKSGDKIVKVSREEIKKHNPKLGEAMEKQGHEHLQFDTDAFEKAE